MSFRIFSAALWLVSVLFVVSMAVAAPFFEASRLPLIGNMLSRPHLIDRATPILILVLFSWVLFEIAVKQRRVRREHAAIAAFQTQIAKIDLDLNQRATTSNFRETRAVLRARLIVDCSRRSAASLHEAVPAAAALDASTLAAGYTSLHVYAWALPVLGFIGTASGMASAISGFKDVLSGGQVQVDTLAAQLSQSVIPGLSAAFETTILALGASLVAYLCTSALRSWEQESLDQLDQICVTFLSQTPQPESREDKNAAILEQISDQLSGMLEFPSKLEDAANSINTAADSLVSAASGANAIGTAADALTSASNESASAADAISTAAQALVSASKELQESVSAPYHITITRGPRQ